MKPMTSFGILLAVTVLCLFAQPTLAVEAASTQPADAPATQPQSAEALEAIVIDVKGRAQHAPAGTAVTDATAWQPVQVNDRYPAETLIRTGLGSHVTLQLGSEQPYTVVMVERMTLANVASLYKTADEKVGRVHINYGAVRGGVSEGGLRSSLVVDSTVATLTKRGTWGFRLFVERGTGRYEISLADDGVVEALNNITRQRQAILAGQYVTQAMRRWVEQASFDRTIILQDRFGVTNGEFQSQALYGGGLSVLDPAATANIYQLARPGFQQYAGQQLDRPQRPETPAVPQGPVDRPEGDFNSRF